MPEVTLVINRAASKLGNPFPFNKDDREKIVGPSENRMNFSDLDGEFYALADTEQFFRRVPSFVPFAEKYAEDA